MVEAFGKITRGAMIVREVGQGPGNTIPCHIRRAASPAYIFMAVRAYAHRKKKKKLIRSAHGQFRCADILPTLSFEILG